MTSDDLVFQIDETIADYKSLRSSAIDNKNQNTNNTQQNHLRREQSLQKPEHSSQSDYYSFPGFKQQQQKKSFQQDQSRFSTQFSDNINNKTKSLSPPEKKNNSTLTTTTTTTTIRTSNEKNSSIFTYSGDDDDDNNIMPTSLKEAIEKTNKIQNKKKNDDLTEMASKMSNNTNKTQSIPSHHPKSEAISIPFSNRKTPPFSSSIEETTLTTTTTTIISPTENFLGM